MSRATVNAICQTFPGAEVSDPWGGGHNAWKVGGKMFACIGTKIPGVAIKTDSIETAEMLIEMGVGRKAPYFHRSWINVLLGPAGRRASSAARGLLPHRARRPHAQGTGEPRTLRLTANAKSPACLRPAARSATVAPAGLWPSLERRSRPWTWSP